MKPEEKKYKIFIKWYINTNHKDQDAIDEFCKRHDVDKEQIQDWLFSGRFEDDLFDEAVNFAKEKTPMIIKSLYDKYESTKEPNYLKHIKDFMALNKKDTPVTPQNNYQFNFLNPSDDQYRQILERETRLLNISSTEEPPELLPTD